jgi:hypothetical protein
VHKPSDQVSDGVEDGADDVHRVSSSVSGHLIVSAGIPLSFHDSW